MRRIIKLSELRKIVGDPNNEDIPGFGRDYSEFNEKKISKIIYNLIFDEWNDNIVAQLSDTLKQKYSDNKIQKIISLMGDASQDRYVAEYGDKTQFDEDEPSERMTAEDDLEKDIIRLEKLLGFKI